METWNLLWKFYTDKFYYDYVVWKFYAKFYYAVIIVVTIIGE